jgi:hypothetical protein
MKNRSYYPFERNRFFYGKLLTVRDFETEQKYFNDKRRFVNRLLHGAGIVCGMGVVATDDNTVSVESGMAVDYLGREIVLPAPITRKLSTIDGFDSLEGSNHCYLYIEYEENLKEPVNTVTGDNEEGGSQFNRIEETYNLYLKPEEPSLEDILNADPCFTYRLLYDRKGLTILLKTPVAVRSGQEARISFIVLKHQDMEPVKFEFSSVSEYFRTKEGSSELVFSFTENPDEQKAEYEAKYIIKAEQVNGIKAALFSSSVNFDVYIGAEHENKELSLKALIEITEDDPGKIIKRDYYSRTLEASCTGEELGICLARIDLMSTNTTYIIRNIIQVPFKQYLPSSQLGNSGGLANLMSGGDIRFDTNIVTKRLNAWEKPEADVKYNAETNSFDFNVGIPAAQAYDYATSTGTVEINLGAGAKLNGRYVSEEISHELGLGNVCVNVCIVHKDNGAMLFGNGDVFKKADIGTPLHKVDTAVIVYPEKGTFKIGLKFLDGEDITSISLRWFAFKPQKDSEEYPDKKEITLRVEPDVVSVKPREEIRFKAFVQGTANKKVKWILKDEDGGSIDENGIYKAASVRGTYEIIARSEENPEVSVSAYVVVNE